MWYPHQPSLLYTMIPTSLILLVSFYIGHFIFNLWNLLLHFLKIKKHTKELYWEMLLWNTKRIKCLSIYVASRIRLKFGDGDLLTLRLFSPVTQTLSFLIISSHKVFLLLFSFILPLFYPVCIWGFFLLSCSLKCYMALSFQSGNVGRTMRNYSWNMRESLLSHICRMVRKHLRKSRKDINNWEEIGHIPR